MINALWSCEHPPCQPGTEYKAKPLLAAQATAWSGHPFRLRTIPHQQHITGDVIYSASWRVNLFSNLSLDEICAEPVLKWLRGMLSSNCGPPIGF